MIKIKIEVPVYQKLKALITNCPTEIMGLGKVTATNKEEIIIKDVVIFKQEATSASTEFDKEKLMEFISERVSEGDASQWRLWWHSHAAMDTFFSGVDTTNIENMGDTAEWMVSLVFNHKMDILGRVDVFKPLRVTQEEVAIEIDVTMPEEVETWAKEEIQTKVTEPTTVPVVVNEFKNWNRKEKDVLGERHEEMSWDIAAKKDSGQPLSKKEQNFFLDNMDYVNQLIEQYFNYKGGE